MKRNHQDKRRYGGGNELSFSTVAGKSKLFEEEQRSDAGMDELLAVLGYKVKSSDMADVAQKLEQLEMVMGTVEEDGISHLASDTVHYNPSDLSSWVQSMLSEFNPLDVSSMSSTSDSRASIYNDHSDYDISAVVYKQPDICHKRTKTGSDIAASQPDPVVEVPAEPLNRPVLVDSQESGVRLVHTLVACAEAIQEGNATIAEALVKNVGILAARQAGAMGKVAMYFAEALARRIYRYSPQDSLEFSSYSDLLQMHFYETCPYLKFAHFTANQAILEAFADADRVHVIDFSLKQGMQWPALMQALAVRPGGPPAFRLTGIGPPQPNNTDALQQVGYKLAQFAETIGVEFEFKGFVTNSLADLHESILEIRPSSIEAVAVNSVFELHRVLARPTAIDKVLNSIKAMKPKIVTMVEQEANHNDPIFLDRFNEALNYFSNMFDSLEGSGFSPATVNDQLMSEMYLGRQIFNVVACEGADRVERHESLTQWRDRMDSAGFEPVPLGSNAFRQASTLLALFAGGDGYRVEENNGCLMLGWHTRPLIVTSAWRIGGGDSK